MRKGFKTFIFVWLIFLVNFNIFVFALPASINGKTVIEVVTTVGFIVAAANGSFATVTVEKIKKCVEYSIHNEEEVKQYVDFAKEILHRADFDIILGKYGSSFWIGYTVTTASFIVLLICGINAFKEENSQKFFYKVSLIQLSYYGLVLNEITCLLCMYIPKFPIWLCVIICVISAIGNIVPLLWANLSGKMISEKDDEIKEKMELFKDITQDSKQLFSISKDENIKKIYEAVKYSDPISNEKLYDIERNIYDSFVLLKDKYKKGENISEDTIELISLIKERNEKCKALK